MPFDRYLDWLYYLMVKDMHPAQRKKVDAILAGQSAEAEVDDRPALSEENLRAWGASEQDQRAMARWGQTQPGRG